MRGSQPPPPDIIDMFEIKFFDALPTGSLCNIFLKTWKWPPVPPLEHRKLLKKAFPLFSLCSEMEYK